MNSRAITIIFVLFSCASLTVAQKAAPSDGLTRVVFDEVDTLFANPGQGWMSQQRSPRREPRFPCSVVYVRFNWADAEPAPGEYNWKIIDDVIAAWKSRRAAVAFRVMTCNAHSAGYYASPKWLFDEGCKGFEYVRGGDDPTSGGQRIPRIEPDYSDPIYLTRHGAFIEALGKRYDGSPDVEFLDIGSYGIWGEWHTPHPASAEVRKQIVNLYVRAFRRTPLVFMSDDAEILKYALTQGTGFRRDGVGSPWHEQNWIGSKKYADVPGMADVWRKSPVVFEWFGDFDYLQSKQWSFEAAVDFMLRNHVTLINDNVGRVPPESMPLLEKLARQAGARFVLRELTHGACVNRGEELELEMKWANVGVGRLYHSYRLQFSLLDTSGRECAVSNGSADAAQWLPGEHAVRERFALPAALEPGTYTLALKLIDASGARPAFRLAFRAPEAEGLYRVSNLIVK